MNSNNLPQKGMDEIRDMAEKARNCGIIPEKSKIIYEKTYREYLKWCNEKKVQKCYLEDNLLAYFYYLSDSRKPSSLWSYYSMLKANIKMYHNTDISNYSGLFGFLKRKSDGYKPKKAKVFTQENLNTFLYEASDDIYLMFKVNLNLGILNQNL